MTFVRMLPVLLLASPCLLAQNLTAPSHVSQLDKGAKVEEMLPNQRAFLNLTEEKRKEFIENFTEANRLFAQKRIFETLEMLAKAHEIFAESPEVYNLKGSCYVEMRSFDKALESFVKASALASRKTSINFNIGEVYFVTRQWAKAANIFEQLIKELPSNSDQLTRLAQFKLMLCKLKLGDKEGAKALAETYDFLDDSPYYYFAQASLAYEEDKLIEAEEWIARAARIFRDPAILSPWQDTMVEYGYIKSFYGGE